MKNSILLLLLPLLLSCGEPRQPEPETLPDPSDVSFEYVDDWSGILHWKDNATNEKGYYVFIVQEGKTASAPTATLPAGSTSYSFGMLTPGFDFMLGVQAFGDNNAMSRLVWCPKIFATIAYAPEDPEVPDDPDDPEDPQVEDPNPIEAITFTWTEVTDLDLPGTVRIYKTEDALGSRPFHAWYAIADPKVIDVRVLYPGNGSKATIDKQAADAKDCYVLINGGIFGTAPIGFAIIDGEQTPWRYIADDNWAVDKQYWGPDSKLHTVSRGLFGVDTDGVPGVYWSFTPTHGTVRVYDQPIPSVAGGPVQKEADESFPCPPADWTPFNAITCGPVLLQNGRCPITDQKTSMGYWQTNYELWADDIYGVAQRADRTAVGCTADGKVILFICDGRISASEGATTLEMAAIMKGLGCVGALNLDGGGSTGMWAAGAHLNDLTGGNRAVMTTIGFFERH